MYKNSIIILIRNPILGKVKTRLARNIGAEHALKIYKYLLRYTKSVVTQVECSHLVFYSDFIEYKDIWDNDNFHKFIQSGSEFGERMYNAFKIALKYHEKSLIIGSDCYEITPTILNNAFKQLDSYDIVIGPAEDGGYYLLGMKRLYSRLFRNKEWSTSSVLKDTINDIEKLDLSYYLLPVLSDIDEIEDLKNSDLIKKLNLE
jgi:hypothetical protein